MCFWFGLEILRLQVYKKSFLKKYLTVSILFDLLSSKKSSTTPYCLLRKSKEASFCADFKTLVLSKRETFLTENLVLGGKIFGHFLKRDLFTFLKLAQTL
jgi:hypothetical protein